MNITYSQNGDYRIPNIVIRKTKPIGHYGRLRKAYLETYRPVLFNELVLSDTLYEHCAEIDEAARNRMELIVPELVKRNGVTEQLKAENQMEWVRQMNACKPKQFNRTRIHLILFSPFYPSMLYAGIKGWQNPVSCEDVPARISLLPVKVWSRGLCLLAWQSEIMR